MQRYCEVKIILNYPISSERPLKSFLNVIEAYKKELELNVNIVTMSEPFFRHEKETSALMLNMGFDLGCSIFVEIFEKDITQPDVSNTLRKITKKFFSVYKNIKCFVNFNDVRVNNSEKLLMHKLDELPPAPPLFDKKSEALAYVGLLEVV